MRIEDWRPDIEQTANDFIRAVTQAAQRIASPLIICLCPASRATLAGHLGRSIRQTEQLVFRELNDLPSVYFVTGEQLQALYTVEEYDDAPSERLASIPYTPLFFSALGTMIARRISALTVPRYKVIVLDCDHTLWDGVCAEDGPNGVRIDAECEAVQKFMIHQHNAGMLLALCSKNNEADVAAVFESHPKMLLKRDHFVSWQVNWLPKSENLTTLADELHLSQDAFIFVDDSPVECAEVRANAPRVLTIQIPEEPQAKMDFLKHVWAFDHAGSTAEAGSRTALYQQNVRREQFQKQALSFREFLASLNLSVDISPLLAGDLARACELTHRTNQFNLTGHRMSVEQIRTMCQTGRVKCLGVRATDRFGDYGLVGLMVVNLTEPSLQVESFLLSCRAMGKGIEYQMLVKLGEMAREVGLDAVEFHFVPTPKNVPAREFLHRVRPNAGTSFADQSRFRVATEIAAAAEYTPEAGVSNSAGVRDPEVLAKPGDSFGNADQTQWTVIAEQFQSLDKIHQAVLSHARPLAKTTAAYVPPATPLEQEVAAIWSDILGTDDVGANDSFFDLGGHSLLAMQVLARISDTLDVELSPSILYLGEFTISGLAKAILAEQIQQAGVSNLAGILDKLDSLSADEVSALLGKDVKDRF